MARASLSSHYCEFCKTQTAHETTHNGRCLSYVCTTCGCQTDKSEIDSFDEEQGRKQIEIINKKTEENTCLWCRIFGHSWMKIVKLNVINVDKSHQKCSIITFANCQRCGKENPSHCDDGESVKTVERTNHNG